jgi:hypothetical protein
MPHEEQATVVHELTCFGSKTGITLATAGFREQAQFPPLREAECEVISGAWWLEAKGYLTISIGGCLHCHATRRVCIIRVHFTPVFSGLYKGCLSLMLPATFLTKEVASLDSFSATCSSYAYAFLFRSVKNMIANIERS